MIVKTQELKNSQVSASGVGKLLVHINSASVRGPVDPPPPRDVVLSGSGLNIWDGRDVSENLSENPRSLEHTTG